jgi:hypothetical protein
MKKDIKVSLEQEIKKIKRWSDILEIGDNTIGVGDTSIPPGFRDSFGEEAEIRTGTDLGATDQMTGYMDMGESDIVPLYDASDKTPEQLINLVRRQLIILQSNSDKGNQKYIDSIIKRVELLKEKIINSFKY